MAKRSHGEGSITRRDNGTWLARISTKTGRISKTFRTRREAADWISSTAGQVTQGLTSKGVKTAFEKALDEWLELKRNKLRPSTMELYEGTINRHIRPALGPIKVADLNTLAIQRFYTQLLKSGVGRRSIEIIHIIIHGCLAYCERQGLTAKNWAGLVEVPRPPKKEMSVWDEGQVNQFIGGLASDQAFYRLAFSTGMRRGELLGLQWGDIDWLSGQIKIKRQVFEPIGGGFVFQEPKTARGRRVISVGDGVLKALRYQLEHVIPALRESAGYRWRDHDLVFPSKVGTPRGARGVSGEFKRLADSLGLPKIRFHDIRHTAASILLLHGSPPTRVAAILGQSVDVLLTAYAHYVPDDQAREAAIMDQITTPIPVDFDSIGTYWNRDAREIEE